MTIQEKLNARRDRRAHVTAKLRQMALDLEGDAHFSDEEQLEFDALEAEVGKIDAAIEQLERIAKIEAEEAVAGTRSEDEPSATSFAGAIRGPEAKKEFESVEEFYDAILVHGARDQRLHYESFSAEQKMNTGSKGGFAIPQQFSDQFFQFDHKGAVVGPDALTLPVGTPPDAEISIPALAQGTAEGPYGGVALEWVDAEKNADLPDTEASIREIKLKPSALAGVMTLTNKMMANWPVARFLMTTLLQGALGHGYEKAFRNGSGAGEPLGYANVAANGVIKINRAGSGAISYADLLNMEKSFIGNDPKFVVSPRAIPELSTMEDTAGTLILKRGDATKGMPSTLLGYKLEVDRRAGALGALGDITLADFGLGYVVKPGSGPYIDVSEHAEFKKGRTLIRIIANVDGQPTLEKPLVDLDESSEVSPIVALDVP